MSGKRILKAHNIRRSNINIFMALYFLVIVAMPLSALAADIQDSDITYWVRNAIYQDPRVNSSEINVNTKDGIVTLTGVVNNLAAKRFADLEAKKIAGVLGVINEIVVTPVWRSDDDIINAVSKRILSNTAVKSQTITVKCLDGRVLLSGSVDSYSEENEAILDISACLIVALQGQSFR